MPVLHPPAVESADDDKETRIGSADAGASRSDGARSHAPDAGSAPTDSRANDEEASEEEIEITAEMISAGVESLSLSRDPIDGVWDESDSVVSDIFRAMLGKSISHRRGR